MSDATPSRAKPGFLSWAILRDALLVVLIGVVAWKLVSAEFKVDISDFSFTDLLALVLALFSVWLSVAFYFKANEASSQFYDNTYRFTKDMSEILGRIEAGFGERLRHLDEGYSGLRDKFDRIPLYEKESAAVAAVEKEEEEVRVKEEEQKQVLESLATKAKLAENEKEELFRTVAQRNKELEQARAELRHLKAVAERAEIETENRPVIIRYITRKIDDAVPPGLEEPITPQTIRRAFAEIKTTLPKGALRDLERYNLMDDDGDLTREGLMRIRIEIRRLRGARHS